MDPYGRIRECPDGILIWNCAVWSSSAKYGRMVAGDERKSCGSGICCAISRGSTYAPHDVILWYCGWRTECD